jgi:hypothetical protein
LPGDHQAHPSAIVESIVELIRNQTSRYEKYDKTMAWMGCEDKMLTITDCEEDGDGCRD